MSMKKWFTAVISLVFVLGIQFSVFANTNESGAATASTPMFSDIPTDHWAYDAISWMAENKVISGYSDGTFKPGNPVTRGEFANMMVLALKLTANTPDTPSFKDVGKDHWAFSAVETAKLYLTYFRANDGSYFKPGNPAEREDMAVALVKALKLSTQNVGEGVLNKFSDKDRISPSLKKYVGAAVKNGIMQGAPVNNSNLKSFNPRGTLTRAETAALLYKTVNIDKVTDEEEKTTDDEEEQPVDSQASDVPKVSGKIDGNRIVISWNKIANEKLQGYKVVISRGDATPAYPENGYLYYITDKNKTSAIIDNKEPYKNGDFGQYLKPGEYYYFSVTALFDGKKETGNAVKLKCPQMGNNETGSEAPKVTAKVDGNKIFMDWQTVNGENFTYYKVVISKHNSSPKYPEDGYLYYITDKNQSYATIDNRDAYNGGDFGKYLEPGQAYYFSVTAVYGDKKVKGNAVKLTYPGSASTRENTGHTVPIVSAKAVDGKILVSWKAITDERLHGYKVVISKSNSRPKYPEDGYIYWITDKYQTSATIDNNAYYSGGDINGHLVPGQKYYFSVTAYYSDAKIPGNAVYLTVPYGAQ